MPKKRLLQSLIIMLVVLLYLSALQVSHIAAGATEDSWGSKAPMHEVRGGLGVAVVGDKIYALGGYGGSGAYLSANEEYDPVTDTWTFRTPMPTPMAYFGVAVYQGKIYCMSGENGTNEVYNPATDTWETRT